MVGWKTYIGKKGGKAEVFNCCTVRLELEDLERLEADLNDEKLEHTPGFFFGDSQIYPEDITETKTFIANARLAIAEGRAVFYDSWW